MRTALNTFTWNLSCDGEAEVAMSDEANAVRAHSSPPSEVCGNNPNDVSDELVGRASGEDFAKYLRMAFFQCVYSSKGDARRKWRRPNRSSR